MRKYLSLLAVGILLPTLLSSCWWDREEATIAPKLQEVTLVDTLARYSTGEVDQITTSLNSEDFSGNTEVLQGMLDKATADNNTGAIIKVLLFQLQNTLNQGNYEYSETESRTKAQQIIDTIISYDPSYANHPQILVFRGYAEEITKNYTGAQLLYEQALGQTDGFSSNTSVKADILNQMSHLQSLMGNVKEAYELTQTAYNTDPTNYKTNTNMGRFLVYSGNIVDAFPYFEYALNTPYQPMRAEIYFTMSSLVANKGSKVYSLDKAIEYAQLSIENGPSYPMGYYALAYAYYMQNNPKNNQAIEDNLKKSIELNPNGYNSYELLGLLKFDKGDFDGAIADIKTAVRIIPEDMLLMEDQRAYNTNRLYVLILLLNHIHSANPIDATFGALFLSDSYGSSNVIRQLDRPDNGFLKDSSEKIQLLLQ